MTLNAETPVVLELWRIGKCPSIAIAPRWTVTGVVAQDRVLSMGQIELFDI